MPLTVTKYAADRESLLAVYRLPIAPARFDRMQRFYNGELEALAAVDFEGLSADDRIDYLLLRNNVTS